MLFDRFPWQFFSRCLSSLGCLLLVLVLFAESSGERLPVKTYTVGDGLLRDSVSKIKQDSRGFLWFCTAEGVSRFDGYAFTNFTTADGLPERHVNDFLETRNGTIYIATDGGLARLNPTGLASSKDNPLFTVILPDDPKAKGFRVLFEDETGTVWAGTTDGLYRVSVPPTVMGGGFSDTTPPATAGGTDITLEAVDLGKPLTGIEAIIINAIIKDRRGALWIGTAGSGLFRFLPNGQIEQFTTANGLPGNIVTSLLEDKNGRIWLGMRPSIIPAGLCLLVAGPQKNQNIVERIFTAKDGLPSIWITDLYEDGDKFWIATTSGLCLWQGENNGSVCKTYTAKNDLCDFDVWTIIKDKDNNLWTGTRCGVKKWARYGFTSYTEADGTGFPIINSIFENKGGELFVSINNGVARTISRFDGEKFELVKPNFPASVSYFGWGWKQTVWQDGMGDWWFPTGYGLFRFPRVARFEDLARTAPKKIETGAKSLQIFRIFEDSRGDIWIATTEVANELLRWERNTNTWRNFTADLGLPPQRFFTTFVEDKIGNLWIGTGSDAGDAALIRYRDGQFKIFTQADGVPAGWIRDSFIDHAGRLWIANTTAGLLRLDNPDSDHLDFVSFTPKEGLSSIGVLCITEDEFGRIYAGTGRGLDRLNPESGQIENFTTADGLPNSNIDVAYRDKKNNLWFGSSNGLARLIPEPEKQREPPKALLTGLRVNGESQSISVLGETVIPPLELNSDQKQVSVDFLGLGANLGEKLKYEYRLDESAWTPTMERTVNFANLNSGEYRFEVRAVTADRIYSQAATTAFRIATPIWQRWWFIVLMLVLAALAAYLFYKNRLLRLLEMERMRTRIAADLHDDIGANLTRISLLSEVARAKSTNGNDNMLSSIADIARESVASMNDIVWAISPDHDRMLDLTRRMRRHAGEIFSMRDIELDFNVPAEDTGLKLSVGVRRDVLLIFKEAVNNAARHSACTKVWIDFRREDSILSLRIKDNGKGFAPDPENDGQGLLSMTRRARALGGTLEIDSGKGEGTIVKFVLPLRTTSFESRL